MDDSLPLPRTALGRQFEAQLGNPLAAFLKWIIVHPRTQALNRHKFKILLAALGSLLAVKLRQRQLQKRVERFLAEQAAQAKQAAPAVPEGFLDPKGFEAFSAKAVKLPSTYEMLRSPEGNMGIAEFFGNIGLCVGASGVMIWKAIVLGMLLARQNDSGFSRQWLYYAVQYPFLCLANVALFDSTGYLKRRIQLKWRRNVTRKLHELYFSRMRYYRILNENKDLIINDPDIRICSDVRDLIGATAEVLMSLTMAVFFTVLFGSATISNRNWRWSLSTPTFFLVAMTALQRADPPQLYAAYGAMQVFSSRLTQLMTRAQLHAERICMLQGESFELHHLQSDLDEMAKQSNSICDLSFLRNALDTFFFRSPDSGAVIECTAMLTCCCMGANDIVANATAAGHVESLPLNTRQPYNWCGNHMAIMMRDMHGFYNACSGWGSFMTAYFGLRDFHHITARLKELFCKLQVLEEESSLQTGVFEDQGPVVAFEGVSIQTPTQRVLLEDLTFKVEQGSSLLICGHNGAGKSSIIRALCSLWPVPVGKIARPGGRVQAEENKQLHDEVYYLPQKPCNVLGSLSDQLTYPLSVPGGLPEAELRRWLRYVGLEYLVDRKVSTSNVSRVVGSGNKHNDIDWEVLLSMGEQQALSIARLLYHHPRFAILDECTSAIGKELERRLFELVREIGISCMTITHRPALKEHHAHLLQLTGERERDGRGWVMSELPGADSLPATKPRCRDAEEVHQRIAAYLEREKQARSETGASPTADMSELELEERRSAGYLQGKADAKALTADDVVRKRWPGRLSRIWAVVRLGLPSRTEKVRACRRLALMLVILRARISLFWFYWRGSCGMLLGSFAGDRPRVLAEFGAAVATCAVCACLDQLFKNQAEHLSLDLWKTTMERLPRRVISGATFLKMMRPPDGSSVPEVENPALRLGEVKGVFDAMLFQINDVVVPLCQGIAFLPSMVTGLGAISPVMLVVNFLLFRGSQLIAPNFPEIQKRTATLESRFQVLHTRLRSIAEPVAFSGGGDAERRIIEPHFNDVLEHYERASRQETLYSMMVTCFTDYRQIPVWTQRLASIHYAQVNNPIHPDGVSGSTITSNFLFDRTIQFPQVAVQKIVKLTEASGRIDGQCSRVLELVAACDAVEAEPQEAQALATPPAPDAKAISMRNLDLVTRRGVCLARGLAFDLEPGVPTVCTGPNASGKTLLGSVLLGLWPGKGPEASLCVPGATGPRPPLRTIMPAPQQIYLPGGALFDQLSYPLPVCHPEGPPTEVRVEALPEAANEAALWGHFLPFGCGGVRIVPADEAGGNGAAQRHAVVTFISLEGACFALAKPQERVLMSQDLECHFMHGKKGASGTLPNLVRMRHCLRAVGIESILLYQPMGWMEHKEWADTLSGGEQQRLCVARVLYHGPTFGLLDECTSMVAADAEQELYRMIFRDWGITPLTLTQRMFMPDFYRRELRLGMRNPDGWELAETKPKPAPVG